MKEFARSLTSAGFTLEEARVYEAALMLGKASITELARKSELKRTSVYHYIENLLKHGLLAKDVHGKRVVYIPQDPEKILSQLEKQRAELKTVLPELSALYSSVRHKPRVEFLENKQELKRAYERMSESFSPIYSVFSVKDFASTFSHKEIGVLNKKLHESETSIYELIENNTEGKSYIKSFRQKNHRVKLLPKDFSFTTDTLVTKNTVLLVSFKNMMGVVIENEEIANFFRNIFMLIWSKT